MKRILVNVTIYLTAVLTNGCTSVVTAPIEVASSVVGAGFHMVGAAGEAMVDTVTGGVSESEEED